MKQIRLVVSLIVMVSLFLAFGSGCAEKTEPNGEKWCLGFGSEEIAIPETDAPLYIAGYHNGWKTAGVLDLQRANAVWLDAGNGNGVLLIGIDCIGLSGQTADEIRGMLADFCKKSGCISVNVFSTHDHAGIDTLGLWGEIGFDGKNADFMDSLKRSAVKAAEKAYESRRNGKLMYGSTVTSDMQSDSRLPEEYDDTLRQFRFLPDDGNGIRMIVYSAHAESLRGSNRWISRDYPGVLADEIKKKTGDDVLFLPGAIGGLIMTSVQVSGAFNAIANCDRTGRSLAEYALSIDGSGETELSPFLKITRTDFSVPLDNDLFLYYRFLGVLGNTIKPGKGKTGYDVRTSLSLLTLGEKTLAMLPCEIFPELVSGNGLNDADPDPLKKIAEDFGLGDLIVTGLCNDEIGYVVTPSDYFLHDRLPFLQEGIDPGGRKHYEETNSVGRDAAYCIADALKKALKKHMAES